MPEQELIISLYDIGAIQFGEFKLKSGLISPIYINLRKIISYPKLLRMVANLMWEKIHTCSSFELICGVPYTALPIATCLSLEHNIPMVMRRKEKKDYGTKQMIEGEYDEGQFCLIVEDVVTTGSSVLETASELEKAGIQVKDIVALIDREQGGSSSLNSNYCFHSILRFSQIIQVLLASPALKTDEREIAEGLQVRARA